jgi:glycerol-1-phosphate dehydrogenase [NAD(P)+]
MDGYASDGAAMILGGMKVTVKAGLPRAIIADTEVLKDAPWDMIQAGYGDIIGKYSALNDWKLSKIVNGEYFCQFIYDTTYQMILNTLNTANGLLERNEQSVKALMEALVIVGVMMSFATSSRPASGSEHHLSHFFEIVGIIEDKPYFAHGIDVAYSTVITAGIREKLANTTFPKTLYKDSRDNYVAKMEKVYQNVGASCVELQDKVGNYKKDRLQAYLDNEKELKEVLKECPTAKEIEGMLNLVKMDIKEFYDMYGKEKIDNAVKYAKDLKDRYSVLWMNYDFFGDNE